MRSCPKSYEEAEDQITQWLTTQQWLWPIKRTMAISKSDSSQTPFRPYPDNECWTGGVVLGVGSASGTLTPAPYLTGYSNLECFSSMLIHLGHTAVFTQNPSLQLIISINKWAESFSYTENLYDTPTSARGFNRKF